MSVGLLIITHAPFGSAAVEAVFGTLGELPLTTRVLDMERDADMALTQEQAQALLNEVDQGDGVLILTDLYGATPSNIATQLLADDKPRQLITGLNLAMLIRIMNYPDLGLMELAQKAVNGAHSSIFAHPPLAQHQELDHA